MIKCLMALKCELIYQYHGIPFKDIYHKIPALGLPAFRPDFFQHLNDFIQLVGFDHIQPDL